MGFEVLMVCAIVLAFVAGAISGWLLALRSKGHTEASSGSESPEAEGHHFEKPQAELEPKLETEAQDDSSQPEDKDGGGASKQKTPAEPAPMKKPVTELGIRLFSAHDPIAVLRDWARKTETRLADGAQDGASPIEAYLLHCLEDAGILDDSFALPGLKIVRPHTNGMFYLRLLQNKPNYGDTLAMLRMEAALNAGVIAEDIFAYKAPASEEEVFAAANTLMERICQQGSDLIFPTPEGTGEWAARMALSHALECLRLPFRLSTQFRMNVSAGEAAIVFEATPAQIFPRHALVEGLGVVPTTQDMRARAQADYTMRVAVLLAQCAFAASWRIDRVWVAAIERTPATHFCLLSTAIERNDMTEFFLDPTQDVLALLERAQTIINYENGLLSPCLQAFSLDEERFCPPLRYETIGLSERELEPAQAKALGTRLVSGLEIDVFARRERMAEEIAKRIPQDGSCSCQEAVRAMLEYSSQTDDAELKRVAHQTAQSLVDGTLEPDPLAIIEALCDDNGLVEAISKSQGLLMEGHHEEVNELMAQAIAASDAENPYIDTPTDEWRCFSSYVDRVFYNLMLAREDIAVHLVPQAYVEALITRSISLMALNKGEEALPLARRAAAICPMSSLVRLHLVQCLDFLGYAEESRQQLVMLLAQAHDPEALGFGYYRMSIVLSQEGHTKASKAAYQRALTFMPEGAKEALKVLGGVLMGARFTGQRDLSPKEMEQALFAAGVPYAPTEEVSHAFMKATQAATDAEVFPVARDFLRVLGNISRDDVLFGVFRSLEDEPDR